jgi:hypothetical protein
LSCEGDRGEAVFGEAVADGANGSFERCHQTEGGVAQRGEGLWGISGRDARGILAEGGVAAPMEPVLDRPMAPVEGEELGRPGPLGREAGDRVDDLAAAVGADRAGTLDPADLGGARPLEMRDNLARRRDPPLLDPPVALLDRLGAGKVGRRVGRLGGERGGAERLDQLRGETRRRRRPRCRPSSVAGSP